MSTYTYEGKTFNTVDPVHRDVLPLCGANHWVLRNCTIDATGLPCDEALSVTWGASAELYNCTIKGAAKLVLCGSGDADHLADERGKTVLFSNCVFSNFGRRAPEVQSSMVVTLRDCTISDWGTPFDTRTFAAFTHSGGTLVVENLTYSPPSLPVGRRIVSFANWLGYTFSHPTALRILPRLALAHLFPSKFPFHISV